MSKEKRIAPRQDVRWQGVVSDKQGAVLSRCLLVNVSATGAKLVVEFPDKIPDSFILMLSRNGGVRRVCDVKWRSGSSIGVKFSLSATQVQETISYINDVLSRLTPHEAGEASKEQPSLDEAPEPADAG
jgi:PilZ domain-containing protein